MQTSRRVTTPLALLLGWLLPILLFSALLSAKLVELNALSSGDFLVLLALWSLLFSGMTLPLAPLALWQLRRARPRPIGAAVLGAGFATSILLFINLLSRWPAAYRASISNHKLLVPLGALDLTVLALAMIGIVGASLWASEEHWVRAARLLAATLVLLVATFSLNLIDERSTPIELGESLGIEPAQTCEASPEPVNSMVLLALDGLSWRIAAPFVEAGEMPNLRHLMEHGVYGPLEIPFPSYSPVVWATIATGLPADEHGINGFLQLRMNHLSGPLSRGPLLNSFLWWGGANRLFPAIEALGLGAREPVSSENRKALALWEVAGGAGRTVGVYDWMNSWPVTPVSGYTYSNTGSAPLNAYPRQEVMAIVESVAPPGEVEHESLVDYERNFATALALYEAFRPDVSLHFNKGVDDLHEQWFTGYLNLPLDDPAREIPPQIAEAYRLADRWIGRFRAAAPRDALFVVVSDHGYEFDAKGHLFSPPGVLVLSGGPFACGREIEGANAIDVAPTLLGALGLPRSASMPGQFLAQALQDRAPETIVVETYPAEWRLSTVGSADDADDDWGKMSEQLEALGYAN